MPTQEEMRIEACKPDCRFDGEDTWLLEQCLTGVTIAQLASDTVPERVILEAGVKPRRRKSSAVGK